MSQFFENTQKPESALLVGVDSGDFNCEESLDELAELAKTAGAVIQAKMTQKRAAPDTATYIGKGRLDEIKEFCKNNETDLLIFDCELTPSQQRNIEDATDIRVVDRTQLILDIFAMRARSGEGKLQVELAQLKYQLTRLAGKGTALSRLGGGIGTRGPGETKLETDKRHIRRRIKSLEDDLEALSKRRALTRSRREKDRIHTVAIVGYTNAGKSTLMNTLTQAGVLAEDKLFATLDPTARALTLPDGQKVMLIDTVGFIRRLPHGLVEAFKSTLEEAANATIILNVCDASSPECAEHLEVTKNLLNELGCEGKPIIAVFNKCDIAQDISFLSVGLNSVKISAKTGEGLDTLLNAIIKALPPSRRKVSLLFPYSMGSDAAILRRDGTVHNEEYLPDGLKITVTADINLLDKYQEYMLEI